MATDNFWGKFRRWRRLRPFWGGLFLMLSAVELYMSANLTLNGIEVHLGPQGFLSYLIPLILLVSGILIWVTPAQRLFYGIVALLAALYSFLGLNLGGFFIGMLLGILGGALVIAWGPPRPKSGTEQDQPPTGEPTDHDEDEPQDAGDDIFGDRSPTQEDIEETQQIQIAGHDDRPHDYQPVRPAGQASFSAPAPRPGVSRLSRNKKKAAVLALVPVAVTATILVAGSTLPASADECPEGLPSRSTSATATSATTTTAAAAAAAAKKKTTAPAAAKTTTPAATTTTGTADTADDSSGNPILDGLGDLVDGVSNLLGISGEESSSPSESPSPSESATSSAPETTAPSTTEPTTAAPTTTAPSATSAAATTATTKPASVLPTASGDEIPCLGARQFGLQASADDIPKVAGEPGLMEVDSLTMYNSTYDGVVDMPRTDGTSYKALKFSMDKAVNKPFSLTMNEPNGSKTVITSKELTTDGTVKFYTPEFKGNLFGLIPVTFTPESPPPLTLPILWFTDAKIKLSYVRCDVLTGKPLKIAG